MTARQYKRIEKLLGKAEDVTQEHNLFTPEGRTIQYAIRELQTKVEGAKARAEEREVQRAESNPFIRSKSN